MKTLIQIRADFPILKVRINGKPLVYLDSAASSQKPVQVLNAYEQFCETRYSNVHRGIHTLGEMATSDYEAARKRVSKFINAPSEKGVIFTRGTTEGVNLVAAGFGRKFIKPGQFILLTPMEHHANLVPWQVLAKSVGAQLRFWPLNSDGTLNLAEGKKLLDSTVALFAFTHVSNVLGTVNPVNELVEMAHAVGAKVLIDGAQAVPHMPVNLKEIGADFYTFSGHKMLGPTGIGVLWGRPEILDDMDPFMTGGEMIREVWLDRSTWNDPPHKFEAGTPPIAEAVALSAAMNYLDEIGMERISDYTHEITKVAYEKLSAEPGVSTYGPAKDRGPIVAFNVRDIHAHDVAAMLDREGVAVRAGHHCAQPLMRWLEVPATARASFQIYNTAEEVDVLIHAIRSAKKVLQV